MVERQFQTNFWHPYISFKVLLAVVFSLLWSSAFIAGKFAIAYCPPLFLLSIRFLMAGPAMLCVALLLHQPVRISFREFLWLCVLGVLNNALYLGLSFTALKTIPSSVVIIIVSCSPFITSLLARRLLSERLSLPALLGMCCGFGGVTMIVLPQAGGSVVGSSGVVCAVLGMLAFSVGTVLFKRAPVGALSLFTAVGFQAVFGGLALLPMAFFLEDSSTIILDPVFLGSLLYLAVVVSVGATALWFYLVRISAASVASTYHYLNPVFGVFLGWLLLGETLTGLGAAGTGFVILGIWAVTRVHA